MEGKWATINNRIPLSTIRWNLNIRKSVHASIPGIYCATCRGLLMVQHRDEATAREVRQFSKSAENGASVRSWLEDSQHERYMVISFPGAWERTH